MDVLTREPQWGMIVDVDRCIGCEACVLACRSENNIETVGDEQASMGRIMDWIHIERTYMEGPDVASDLEYSEGTATFIPMMCQHCGNAPCESVCPVFASSHTFDGLNAQIYNRCVGTRFCANNCPYHVRVFNLYPSYFAHPLEQQLNPDVTVRQSGVMEKCTFCVQRIRSAQQDAGLEGKEIKDGELRTACVQSCPTTALIFGNLNDPTSAVSKYAASSRAKRVLEDNNTLPHVIYLKPERVADAF